MWRVTKKSVKRPNIKPSADTAPEKLPGPRWNLLDKHAYTHRIEFNPGADAFAYSNLGLPEFPVAAGFLNSYQFLVFSPQPIIQPEIRSHAGLGQSANMQQPAPGAPLYSPAQIELLTKAAIENGTLPASYATNPSIWGAVSSDA